MTDQSKFYVGIFKEEDTVVAHSMAPTADEAANAKARRSMKITSQGEAVELKSPFHDVLWSFISIMQTYRNFVPLTLSISKAIVPQIFKNTIENFVKEKGSVVAEYSSETAQIYEISTDYSREFSTRQDEVVAANQGASHLPEVMLIGLISSYDAFLSNLLKAIFHHKEETIFNSEKMIPFNIIAQFETIQAAKDYLIEKEVESVIRKSHHEQFSWMEHAFALKLRSNLDAWPIFIEICERRNLLTHTGGVVSQQYIDNCKEQKHVDKANKVGDRLGVSSKYFSNSVDIVSEIGIKLSYVMWRKFEPTERELADTRYNHICFELLIKRSYQLAQALLVFGCETLSKGGSERVRRMMVVNLALSMRLQGRVADAVKTIDKEDWSATGLDFQICSNAAKGSIDEVIRLMPVIGNKDDRIDAQSYRDWPVFRGLRKENAFAQKFKDVFGEDLVVTSVKVLDNTGNHEAENEASISSETMDGKPLHEHIQ